MDTITDAKMKATDFIDNLISNDFLSKHLDNANILKNSLDYFLNAISYIPKIYKEEFKNKVFNYVLSLFSKTNNENTINNL